MILRFLCFFVASGKMSGHFYQPTGKSNQMIDFELTEDHNALVQTVREFAQKEVAPHIKEWDEKQQFDPSVLKKMAALNLLGVCIPEEYTWGSEEQKQKYLAPQARGEKIATYGLTEPGAGSDVVGARSTARREGNEWILNGEKMWISLADVADNFLFFCWTDEEKRRKRDHTGMSCFIVERSMKGFSSGTIHGKLGIRAGNTGYFSLQDVRVPQENMVGEEGEGFKIAMFALEQGRYTVAAGATGVIRAARDASVAYANTRETFGTRIANHQLVKQKIAEMEADYQMSHLLWLRAGWLKNEGQANAKATSLAKWQATTRSEKAASMAIEVHGANGYSNDYPVERYLRNCKAAIIYEGTRDIHTLMQADWALGLKKEKPARRTLPPWKK
jgi:glutaryl-CoA dehydrogenase (non-decarboxylating)